ncbi:MAG: hypothetical protein QS2022_3700 [Candidatus Phytoplasma asteris]|uniref:Chromosome segregation ATPases n=1 Tax='Chrysanthemum coronarium' phytoplasma TaxID=1520703 RepID=A0ABQ0J365_9MOLU|nr:hypothetical protein ['Chrysanthemum coronarium' phytoplasma]TKA87951.1 MAG: putative secreted protein [Periwinkle leaf yellowing phytoplasma]WEX19620.1 MAG: hypothetical protein QS2022_3700 [Candidatus Phytoplasma asteris]GAK74042.1 chromosome segregation ATPases ['Chrysanthemum coronarium' phytoplasma]
MNFFKKHWITILIILFFSIVIIIGLFKGISETKQEKKQISNYHEKLNNEQKPNHPLRTKREIDTPKPKIKITQEKYNKIKSYILSENEDEVLLLSDISKEEKTVIEEARASHKQTLEYRKEDKTDIDEKQQECNNLITQRDSIKNQIPALKEQLKQKETELANKEKEIKDKQEELKITTNTDDKKRLQDEIQNLQGQTTEIVEQIMKIKREIANLEATREKYEANLSNAIKLKDSLQRDYDKSQNLYGDPLKSLNSLYEINPNEG